MLKVNVGLSKKVGEANYGSKGATVNLELELDGVLVSEPDKLKERIRQLFTLVRSSLIDELNGHSGAATESSGNSAAANGSASGAANNGSAPSGQRNPPLRPATQSQVKAIIAIARSQKLDLKRILHS